MSAGSHLVIHKVRDVTVVTFNDTSILDTLTIQRIGEQLFEQVDNKAVRKLVLDLSSVKLLSSSALGMLLSLRKKAVAIKGTVAICGVRPEVHKMFKITNLQKLFVFFDSEDKALNSFGVTTSS